MTPSENVAARILIVYEATLPLGVRASLAERIEAMARAVDALQLEEGGVNLQMAVNAARLAEVTA